MINVYFDMPHLEAYLEAAGANFNEVHLQNIISDFLEEAILHHVQEKKFMIMGALNEFLENTELFEGSRTFFRWMPAVSEDIFFDTDMSILSECSDYLVDKEQSGLLAWKTTGKRGEQQIFKTTDDVCCEMDKEMTNVDDEKDYPILFLDFDGVLNTDRHFCEMKIQGQPCRDCYGPKFDPESVVNLQKIVETTDARIVASSSWRYMGLEVLQRMWYDRDLPGKIVGITPLHTDDDKLLETDLSQLSEITAEMFSSSRGSEIKAYFDEVLCKDSSSCRYVILDDLKDVLPEQEEHFIRIDPAVGITKKDAEKAIEKLMC